MKKFLFLMSLLIFVFVVPVFAQASPDPPTGIIGSFATIAGVVSLTLLITGWIKTALKLVGKWARWVSWAVAIVISLVGWMLNFGLFEPLTWYIAIGYGFGIGLVANGLFTADTIQLILAFFKAQVKKE
jgi:hypothetical protein